MQVKKPRVLEFMRDYDKLRHGTVSFEQFFRAFETAGITFTKDEADVVLSTWGSVLATGNVVEYVPALKELNAPAVDPLAASSRGSLAGATFAQGASVRSDAATATVDKLIKAVASHPVIGK